MPATTTQTATAVTRALRTIWPAPITLKTAVTASGEIQVVAGVGCWDDANGAAKYVTKATGRPYAFARVQRMRCSSNIRITYVPAEQCGEAPAAVATTTSPERTASHGLPAGWKHIQAGLTRHTATGTEVVKSSSRWWINVPGAMRVGGTVRAPGCTDWATRAEAIAEATEKILWRTRALQAKAWDEAHFTATGRTHTWLGKGQADAETVAARHAAVRATQTTTGHDAEPGDLIVHLELGVPGVYIVGDDSIAQVRFAGDVDATPTHPDDVVVLPKDSHDYMCTVGGVLPGHDDHFHVDSPECLIPREAAEPFAALAAARAERARLDALPAGQRDAGAEQMANITLTRCELACDLALGATGERFLTFEASYGDDTWEFINWHRDDAEPGESADGQARRAAIQGRLAGKRDGVEYGATKPWRVRAYTRAAGEPDGEWTNITEPCPPGEHTVGRNPVASSVGRSDGSTISAGYCENCFHRVHRVRPYGTVLPGPWLLETEPLPDPEPGVIYLLLECVREEHYGMQINNGAGEWFTLVSVGPYDREAGKTTVTLADRAPVKVICGVMVQLRPRPEGPGGPGPDGPSGNPDHPDPDPGAHAATAGPATADGPSPSTPPGPGLDTTRTPVAFGYQIDTRTGGEWTPAGSGWTPPLNVASQVCLDATADTILSNARNLLGLGPKDPMPEVRVLTWARGSTRSGRAARLTTT